MDASPTANATRTLANFKGIAANAAANLPGGAVAGGEANSQAGTGSGSSGSTNGEANPTSSAASPTDTGSAAMALRPAVSLGGALAVLVALLM